MTEPQDPNRPPSSGQAPPGSEVPPPSEGGYPPPPPPPPPTEGGYPPPPGYYPPAGPGAGGFSVGEAFGWGWRKFRENLGPLVIVALAIVAVLIVLGIIRIALTAGSEAAIDPATGQVENPGLFGTALISSVLLGLIQFVVSVIVSAGIIKGALDITQGRPLELGTMFKGFNLVQLIIASILTSLLTFVGLIACLVGALVVAFFLSFTTYFIVDDGQSAIDAMKASFQFTKANAGDLLLLFLAIIGANILGACLCGIGLLVSVPVTILAQAYAYRALRSQPIAP
jgi:uncharacterized membrane protein